jgi:hypothetical protein
MDHAYALVDKDVIEGLTGSESPDAAGWWQGIEDENEHVSGTTTHKLKKRPNVFQWKAGDIMAAKYLETPAPADSGHAMLIVKLELAPPDRDAPDVEGGVRWLVTVVDSTKTPHGDDDTRYLAENGVNDEGIGRGQVIVYADGMSGAIKGWMWSRATGASVYLQDNAFACTAKNGICKHRPLRTGRLISVPSGAAARARFEALAGARRAEDGNVARAARRLNVHRTQL